MINKNRFYFALILLIGFALADKPTTTSGYNDAFT